MPHNFLSLDDLASHLGRDRRQLEKLVSRGNIPGQKVEGEWRFHSSEIRHWLEQELRSYSDAELTAVEAGQGVTEADIDTPVASLLHPDTTQVPLDARTRRSVLESMVEVAGRSWQVWEPAALLQAILDREEVYSTGFDHGVAIPHPRNPLPQALGTSLIAFGRTTAGIPFGAPGRSLTDLFFLVLCRDSRTHLRVLARLGRLLQVPGFIDTLRAAPDSAASYEVICAADRALAAD